MIELKTSQNETIHVRISDDRLHEIADRAGQLAAEDVRQGAIAPWQFLPHVKHIMLRRLCLHVGRLVQTTDKSERKLRELALEQFERLAPKYPELQSEETGDARYYEP